jgi:hypothetical protein
VVDTYHQLYLRTSRGGRGIDPRAARDEVSAVFGPASVKLDDEVRGSRLRAAFFIDDTEVQRLAPRLGYCEAVVRVSVHPRVERDLSRRRGRVPTGWWREDGRDLFFEPLWVASATELRAPATAPSQRRRLSLLDARFVANLCRLFDGALVVDPFAGLGGLTRALRARGLRTLAFDVDAGLGHAVADARALPLACASVCGVVSEPPYRRHERAAVVAAVAEMARVVRRGGSVTLLVASTMLADLEPAFAAAGLFVRTRHPVVRHGLAALCVVLERP